MPPVPKKKAAKKKAAKKKAASKKAPAKKKAAPKKKGPAPGACSFCGKDVPEVQYVIQGPDVWICDECVGLSVEILHEKGVRVRMSNLVATYENPSWAAAVLDAWPGMLAYVGGAGCRVESLNQRISQNGDAGMRWESLPGEGKKRFVPWWTQDLTADDAHAHVREAASRIDYPAVGTLFVQWIEHSKGRYAVSIGFVPGLFVQAPVEKEPVWAPRDLLKRPGESEPRSVVMNSAG